MTPERILDYYPDPIEGGVITAGASIYCRGKAGVSLLEIMPEESGDKLVVVKVTTALPPRTSVLLAVAVVLATSSRTHRPAPALNPAWLYWADSTPPSKSKNPP